MGMTIMNEPEPDLTQMTSGELVIYRIELAGWFESLDSPPSDEDADELERRMENLATEEERRGLGPASRVPWAGDDVPRSSSPAGPGNMAEQPDDKPVRVCSDDVESYVEKFGKEAAERYYAGCVMDGHGGSVDGVPVSAFLTVCDEAELTVCTRNSGRQVSGPGDIGEW